MAYRMDVILAKARWTMNEPHVSSNVCAAVQCIIYQHYDQKLIVDEESSRQLAFKCSTVTGCFALISWAVSVSFSSLLRSPRKVLPNTGVAKKSVRVIPPKEGVMFYRRAKAQQVQRTG